MTGAAEVLGSPTISVPPGIEFEQIDVGIGDARLVLRATADLEGLATGRFSVPSCGVGWAAGGFAPGVEFVGFAYTQFALPVVAGASLEFDFRPAPGLRSPPVMAPLLARAGGRVVLLAPLTSVHEQVVAVVDDTITWGWHGDLDVVPAGFSTELGVYTGTSVTDVLDRWRDDLAPIVRPPSDNPLMTHLSYWTDNGAAYWYRTEPGRTIAESVAEVVDDLRRRDVPVRAVELDSWFYEHEHPREIRPVGYPDEVPPSGAMSWTPRADAFPSPGEARPAGDALEVFSAALGAPLVLHARHLSPRSPAVADDWWVGDHAALPGDPSFFRRWFTDAVRWGAVCIEQDWMMVVWFGNRELRRLPGRGVGWQTALDSLAGEHGVDLLWCMATPADLVHAARLEHVVAVRTCDDYRFADDPAFLWTWFLTVNRLATTLGLPAFKDCFFSAADVVDGGDPIDGDPHAELEALLSALSGGPVGIGDRIGRTDREIVMRTVDADGRIRPVDHPIGLVDDCMFGAPARGDGLAWATTTATDARGRVWTYVLAVNTAVDRRTIADRRTTEQLGLGPGPARIWDWRSRTAVDTSVVEVSLGPRDWALFVCAPAGVTDDFDDVGDTTKYVVVPAAR